MSSEKNEMKNNNKPETPKKNEPCAKKLEGRDEKIEQLEKKILELEIKAAERDSFFDKYMRAQAEYDNAVKRMEKDKFDAIKYANESIMGELFPILDSFDSAMASLEKIEKDKKVMDGLKMIQDNFHKVLDANGLTVIANAGERFDPIKHEAVMKVQSDKYDDGVVAEVIRKGYALNGKVLRPAMVKVAMKGE